jgi:hypothetical protein
MTGAQALAHVTALYRVFNVADHETNPNPHFNALHAGACGCKHLDKLVTDLLNTGAISQAQHDEFYANI